MTDLSHVPVLVPEHVEDASAWLKMGALDSASNHLGCDLVEAVQGNVPGKRYAAWVELAYQCARQSGVENAKRETYRDYTIEEIQHAVGWDREVPDPTQQSDEPNDSSPSDSSESP